MAEKITSCPVCGGIDFTDYLEVEDHFLSKEQFVIQQCSDCGFRFVNPRPAEDEIGRYYQSEDYISHGAGKADLVSRIYRTARFFSIRSKYRIVKKFSRQGKILDIGCGTGEFLAQCRKMGFEVAGIEPNEKARNFARSVNGISVNSRLGIQAGEKGTFDCITMWHVLEHVHDLDATFGSIKKLLTADGIFIAAVPNSNSWDASKYKCHWAAYDVPRHLYHFTAETMQALASKHGFGVLKTNPQKLDAYYVSMLSEKYLSGRANYFRSAVIGFWSNRMAKKRETGHSSLIFVLALKKG